MEVWDARDGILVAAGDRIPDVVSADGRFGVETRTGALRVWQLRD
jgi:hypothetical protein